MEEKVLVTGATGNTGLEVIRLLVKKGVPVTAALRDPKKDKEKLPEGADNIEFDFGRPETWKVAAVNVSKVYLVRPPVISDVKKYIFPVIDVFKEIGIKHIVFLSLLGAENNSFTPHHKIEKYILQSGIPYTFIRPGFFMQNISTTHLEDIQKYNEVFVPAGKGKTSFIDVRNISEVIAQVLSEGGHQNKAYELTGKKALDYYQVAEILSKAAGRKIVYSNPSALRFFFRMKRRGIPSAFILVMIAIYTVSRLGKAGTITGQLEKLLGKEPITFEKFAYDYRDIW